MEQDEAFEFEPAPEEAAAGGGAASAAGGARGGAATAAAAAASAAPSRHHSRASAAAAKQQAPQEDDDDEKYETATTSKETTYSTRLCLCIAGADLMCFRVCLLFFSYQRHSCSQSAGKGRRERSTIRSAVQATGKRAQAVEPGGQHVEWDHDAVKFPFFWFFCRLVSAKALAARKSV
jgi:hypothetical protein